MDRIRLTTILCVIQPVTIDTIPTGMHSSRMRTARLLNICLLGVHPGECIHLVKNNGLLLKTLHVNKASSMHDILSDIMNNHNNNCPQADIQVMLICNLQIMTRNSIRL